MKCRKSGRGCVSKVCLCMFATELWEFKTEVLKSNDRKRKRNFVVYLAVKLQQVNKILSWVFFFPFKTRKPVANCIQRAPWLCNQHKCHGHQFVKYVGSRIGPRNLENAWRYSSSQSCRHNVLSCFILWRYVRCTCEGKEVRITFTPRWLCLSDAFYSGFIFINRQM